MNKITSIFLLFFFFTSCGNLKKKKVVEHDAAYIHAFHEGVRLKMNGQQQEAIDQFNACLLKDAQDDAAHFALAQIYLTQNDLDQAAIHTKRASELDPKNEHYQSELAFMYVELKKYDEAIVVFEKLLKKAPTNQSYYSGAAECYSKLGNVKKGIELLTRMENNLGANPGIAIEKFKLLVAAHRDEEGIQVLMDAKKKFVEEPMIIANLVDYYLQHKKFQEGFNLLKELVAVDPNNGMALLMLGDMQMQSGDVKNGLINLKAAIKADGPNLDQKMNVLIGLQGQEVMDPDMESLVLYMRTKYPKEAKAHSIAGDYYFKVNQAVEAIEAYKAAIKCDPNVYPIWNQVLALEYQYKQFDSLSVDAEKCIGFYPTQSVPYFLMGAALNQQKNYQKALTSLQTGVDLVLKDDDLKAEFLGQIGESEFGLKHTKEAISAYERALTLSPNNTFVKNNFAYSLAFNELELTRAEKIINEVLTIYPNEARYLDTKGLILFQQGKYSEAKSVLEQACFASSNNDPSCVEHLGDALFMLGKKEEAFTQWLRAKELGSTNSVLIDKITQKKYAKPIF
ncbi:MAG: tetratricopeptide repeat protein [Flavobacteriales bacterium]